VIVGTRYWDDRDRYHVQTNNAIEALLRVAGGTHWLETCGPTAAATCLDMLGYELTVVTPGVYRPQAEDVLSLAMNDAREAAAFEAIRAGVSGLPENRVPQFFPRAVDICFGAKGLFLESTTWPGLMSMFNSGRTLQLCRMTPGHYIPAVAYDDDTQEIIYHDPWPQRFGDGVGWARRLAKAEWETELHHWAVVYWI